MSTMKAVQIAETGGPNVLQYIDAPRPAASKAHVVVQNRVSGVNYIDTYHRSGLYPVPLPRVMGVEGAGTVEEVGPGVTQLKAGDRVAYTAPGSYAQYTAVPADRIVPLPDDVSFEYGATSVIQGMTAVSLLTQAYEVKKGDTILVHAAAGGTGQALTQIARHLGAHVIATVSTPEKAQLAKSLGAEHVILYTQQDVVTEVQRITGGAGVAAVYDGVGAATFDASLASLANGGSLISFGNASGKVPPFDLSRLSAKNVRLMRPTLFNFVDAPEKFAALSQRTLGLVRDGALRFQIHKQYPLSQAAQAHQDLESRGTTGKLLLKPWE